MEHFSLSIMKNILELRKNRIMKRIIWLLFLVPLTLLAEQYTLDELIDYGLKNSLTMQSSGLTYESIRSNLTSAKLNLLPEVSLDLGVRNDFYHPETPKASDISSSAGFSISKSLSLNDTYWYNYKYAQLDEKKGALDLQSKISSYAYHVFTAYLDVLSAQKQLISLNKNLEIQTRVWEQTKVLNQLGKNTSFDVKESEIAVMNSRISILQLENTIATMRRELFGLVNMEDEGYDLADLEPDKELAIPAFSPETSYAIKKLQNELSRTQLSLKQNKTDFLPQLKLTYSFARNAGGEDFSFESYNTEHTLSLGVSYSIWNQFKQKQTVKRSNLSVRIAELNLQDQLDVMKRQYEILTRELEYLKRLDELYQEQLEQANNQIQIAEERYRLGLIDLLTLDKTRVDFINSEISYYSNRYQILAKQEAINNLLSLKIMGKW